MRSPAPFAGFAYKALVGGYKWAVTLNCERKVKAIISWMLEFDRELSGCLEQRSSRQELDIRGLKKSGGQERLVVREFVSLNLFPQDVRTFSDQEFRRYQPRAAAQHQCFGCAVLL